MRAGTASRDRSFPKHFKPLSFLDIQQVQQTTRSLKCAERNATQRECKNDKVSKMVSLTASTTSSDLCSLGLLSLAKFSIDVV